MPQQLLFDLARKYPNTQGVGFDLSNLINTYVDHVNQSGGDPYRGIIRGNSGDAFRFELSPYEIAFREASGYELMRAYVRDGVWRMELFTRDSGARQSPGPHPDMFARTFIDFAWEFLRSHPQTSWDTCIGEWHNHSMINKQYYNNLAAGQSELIAAANTWSGRFYNAHGFRPVKVEHVDIDTNDVLMATYKPIQHPQGGVYYRH